MICKVLFEWRVFEKIQKYKDCAVVVAKLPPSRKKFYNFDIFKHSYLGTASAYHSKIFNGNRICDGLSICVLCLFET